MRDQLRFIDEHSKRISLLCEADRALTEEVYTIPLYQNNIRVKAGKPFKALCLTKKDGLIFTASGTKKRLFCKSPSIVFLNDRNVLHPLT